MILIIIGGVGALVGIFAAMAICNCCAGECASCLASTITCRSLSRKPGRSRIIWTMDTPAKIPAPEKQTATYVSNDLGFQRQGGQAKRRSPWRLAARP
jgi:hypothetical protein